jgi:DNA-binding Lrp family transcriptional regulator
MHDADLDIMDRRLLGLAQREFPLTRSPYTDLGRRLELSGDEVIERLGRLKSDGMVRQIGPVMDSSRLGYHSTLAAMQLESAKLESAARVLAIHAGISHAYLRDHAFNIWFTLAIPADISIAVELDRIARGCGAAGCISLPALKVFKLRTYFDMEGGNYATLDCSRGNHKTGMPELTQPEKLVINELQQDLSLTYAPFASMASDAGMDEGDFVETCVSLMRRGVIRRYGASLDHNRAGYKVNALTCWQADPGKVDFAARQIAVFKEVSHCYERKTPENWRYNLFAMLHCRDKENYSEAIGRLSAASGLDEFISLFTLKELKKTRIKYAV